MDSKAHRVVRLLRNRLYPTYQLYAMMENRKTKPRDGLRLGALTVLEWLRERLDGDVPAELVQPPPAEYRTVGDDCLRSLHMSCGFVIDIVSLPDQGVWTLQITEPDLGSDPGNPEQVRQPVPGRILETNIGFRIRGDELECGFQTVVSDPKVVTAPAEVYRLAVIRRLINNGDFGLRQIFPLSFSPERITTAEQIKKVTALQKEEANHIPTVLLTYARREVTEQAPPPPLMPLSSAGRPPRLSVELTGKAKELSLSQPAPKPRQPKPVPAKAADTAEPYLPCGTESFAEHTAGFCRTFLLEDSLLERFNSTAGTALAPGDILLLEPDCFGGQRHVYAFKPSRSRQEETIKRLTETVTTYPREKTVRFGGVTFLSSARQDLLEAHNNALRETEEASRQYALDFSVQEERWKAILDEKESECLDLKEQIARLQKYQDRLEREKNELRESHRAEAEALQLQFDGREQLILALRRKLGQPKEHTAIAPWVSEQFGDRLFLHPKAVVLLEEKSAQGVDVGLICDALDFLATDYWENRYQRIPEEEMLRRCSEKYGRRFEIKHTGVTTISYTPTQYRIKYFPNPRTGKPMESDLDYHLRVGSDPENLLRIYFLHDDEKKKIVIGSLPRHLKAVTIK